MNQSLNAYHAKGAGQPASRTPEAAGSRSRISKAPPGLVKQTVCSVISKGRGTPCGNVLKSEKQINMNACWSHLGMVTKAVNRELTDAAQ